MPGKIKKAPKGVKTAYLNIGAWFNEETGHIHLAISDKDGFHTTVNNRIDSKRGHPNLYKKLSKALQAAGVPYPEYEEPK